MEHQYPQTCAVLLSILDRTGKLCQATAPEELVTLCRKLERENEKLRAESYPAALGLLADIRAAVGDAEGKLMQDELVARCRKLAEIHAKITL